MKFNCPNCGVELSGDVEPGDSGDCPNCGKEFTVPAVSRLSGGTVRFKKCPSCGTLVEQDSRFCSNCGTAIAPAPYPPSQENTAAPLSLGRIGRCKYCGKTVRVGDNPCPNCGHELKWVRRSATSSGVSAGRTVPPPLKKTQEKDEERQKTLKLSDDLHHLNLWGFNNVVAEIGSCFLPFGGILVGLSFFCFNPVWWIVGPIFAAIGESRLSAGDFDGARKWLYVGRAANWVIVLIVVIWGYFAVQAKMNQVEKKMEVAVPEFQSAVSDFQKSMNELREEVGNSKPRSSQRSETTGAVRRNPSSESSAHHPARYYIENGLELPAEALDEVIKAIDFRSRTGNEIRDREIEKERSAPFKGKRIVVSGKVVEVKSGFLADAKIKIRVHGKTIMAAFMKMSESEASAIDAGDDIKLSGCVSQSLFYDLDLDDCRRLDGVHSDSDRASPSLSSSISPSPSGASTDVSKAIEETKEDLLRAYFESLLE